MSINMKFEMLYKTLLLIAIVCSIQSKNIGLVNIDQNTNAGHSVLMTDRFDGFEPGDVQNCPQKDLQIAEVLPGNGWDNLRNIEMASVVAYNFSKCKIFRDRSFLLPDHVEAEAIKESAVQTYSQLITHFSNFTSTTAESINVGAHASFWGFSVSGSFSKDYKSTKMHIAGDKSTASRVQLRYRQYRMLSEPDPQLHPTFRNRVLDIASAAQSQNRDTARYLSELLVRDYGSHFVSSVTSGAAIIQTDELNSAYVNSMKSDSTTIKAAASASFLSFVGISGSYTKTVTNEQITKYAQNRIDSKTDTIGGPPYKANFSLNEWVNEIGNNLVAIDRDGDPLYYIITPRSLPELPLDTVQQVADHVQTAVESYYKHNIYQGCTDINAPNFSYMSNFDDGFCHSKHNNYTFGGVYQLCNGGKCDASKTQVNPKTGGFSCQDNNYQKVLLHEQVLMTQKCEEDCDSFLGIHYNCHTNCYYTDDTEYQAHYQLYWCAADDKVADNSGYLFGGAYTDHVDNPVTQLQSCPPHFTHLKLGWNIGMHICISDDYELAYRYSVKFSGFFSCASGNPLSIPLKGTESLMTIVANMNTESTQTLSLSAYQLMEGLESPSKWPRKCPEGYSQHLWTIDNGCEIQYCVIAHGLTEWALPEIRRPPYQNKPTIIGNNTNLLVTQDNQIWMRSLKNSQWKPTGWTTADKEEVKSILKLEGISMMSRSQTNNTLSNTNSITVTVLAIISTVLIGVIIIFMVFKGIKKIRGSRPYEYTNRNTYNTFDNSPQASSGENNDQENVNSNA